MSIGDLAIHSFLRLGYFIDFDEELRPVDFSRIDKATYAGTPREELIRVGMGKLRDTFSSLWRSSRDNVVPLSGGLDSRLILGALMEHTEAKNIQTYTFGVPGSYDYEIGKTVARSVGVRHASIPINGFPYHEDELLDVARRTRCQATLFYHPPVWELDKRYGGAVVWSGYVGDAVVGSHLHEPPSATLDAAKRLHLRNRTFVRSIRLHRCGDEELLSRMDGGRQDPDLLTWDEQVLFDEAVAKFTAPLVLFQGFDYRTPLINTPWMDFSFSVPNQYRIGQKLMIDIARRAFPDLFRLPSKNRLGHTFTTPEAMVQATVWMNRLRKRVHQFVPQISYPGLLYNDFNEALRRDPSLRRVVRNNVEDLKKRGICDWIDFEGIWRRHDWRIKNHGDALIVLASLELVMKAREAKSGEPVRHIGVKS